MTAPRHTGPATTPVHGTDLVAPVAPSRIARILKHARGHPWPGNEPLSCPGHLLDSRAVTEPGRWVRILVSLDYGYHASGWFANSDYERCLHLSVSHPRPDAPRMVIPAGKGNATAPTPGMALETPSDAEVRAWGRVFFREHAPLAWFEPAAGTLDPYRLPNIVHLRLYLDAHDRPFLPTGEVYHLRPWADGSSPAKITHGRAGADVR